MTIAMDYVDVADFTIWFTEEAIDEWQPARAGSRGLPQEYFDIAIETAVFIRQVFYQSLRQTEGFMNSLARVITVVPGPLT